ENESGTKFLNCSGARGCCVCTDRCSQASYAAPSIDECTDKGYRRWGKDFFRFAVLGHQSWHWRRGADRTEGESSLHGMANHGQEVRQLHWRPAIRIHLGTARGY